jgi:hypothetical protein
MARQTALNIYAGVDSQSQAVKDQLAETYGQVIEAIQKAAISEQIKNKNYSGDPSTGSVEIDRFKNAAVNNYGTARTAGNGDALDNTGKVTVNIDTDKEIVEELEKKDVDLYGIAGMAEKRKVNHEKRMVAYLDREFFTKAEAEGSAVTPTGSTVQEKLEELIQSVETTVNDWVDGVDRDMLVITVTPAVYGQLLNYIDSVPNSLTGLTENMFHNVRIFSNHRQTKSMLCMIDGAVAQPVVTDEYDAERIPLSNAIALELFFSKGTKAVMPDLIKYVA